MHALRVATMVLAIAVLVIVVLVPAVPAPAEDGGDLRRAFSRFISAKELRFDTVPDIYPGGYARISIYARRANVGGMIADEAWFRFVGASLDPDALRRGELRILEVRDASMHVRASIKNLEEYFQKDDAIRDIKLWSDGEYLYVRGIVALIGVPTKVYLKGSFEVGGTKDVFFRIDDLRVNGLPMFTPLIRKWERDINPVFKQTDWPVTFKIRGLRMTREWFVVTSLPGLNAPCDFCWGFESPNKP